MKSVHFNSLSDILISHRGRRTLFIFIVNFVAFGESVLIVFTFDLCNGFEGKYLIFNIEVYLDKDECKRHDKGGEVTTTWL